MKKISVVFIFIIIFLNIPLQVMAANFKSGDIVEASKTSRIYIRETKVGEQRYTLKKNNADLVKGQKVVYKGKATAGAYNIDASVSELKDKELALIAKIVDGKEGKDQYIILMSNLKKASEDKVEDTEILDIEETGSQTAVNDAKEKLEEEKKKKEETKDEIYVQPEGKTAKSSGESIDDLISDADDFVKQGDSSQISSSDLQDFSNVMYNILLTIGIVVAVIVGAIIGIKLMSSGIETKVEAKKLLIPYGMGCVAVFGAFAIWKIVVNILQGV